MDEPQRAVVGRAGLVDPIEPAQQLRASGVQVVVVLELEALRQREGGLDVARFRDGDRVVQLDDRRAGAAGELAVQGRDLRPILGLFNVQGRQRGLQHVRTPAAERQRAIERGPTLRDLVEVPERSILIPEEDHGAVGEPRVAPGVVHQHQGQQAVHLGLVGHELSQGAAEPDRLGGEVAAAAVALVEDQVDDREHRGEAVGQQMSRRHAKRDAGGFYLALRAHEPLGHGRLGDEEGARDLLGGQPAQRPERKRDLGVERERRMAAHEDELQPLVGDGRLLQFARHPCLTNSWVTGLRHVELADLRRQRAIAPDAVDRPVARGGHEPGARVLGRPVAWPALGGGGERVLGGFLGELEVAEEADQRREDASPLVAENVREGTGLARAGAMAVREGPGLARAGAMVSLPEDR